MSLPKAKAWTMSLMRDPLANRIFGATVISGIISGITLVIIPGALWVGPGIFFGIATAAIFISCKWLDAVRGIIWVAASTGAWYLAVHSYVMRGDALAGGSGDGLTSMLQSGLIGALVLALVFSILVRKINAKAICVTVGCGLVLAAVMNSILASGPGTQLGGSGIASYAKLAAAFAVWQVGVGLSLLAYVARDLSPAVPGDHRLLNTSFLSLELIPGDFTSTWTVLVRWRKRLAVLLAILLAVLVAAWFTWAAIAANRDQTTVKTIQSTADKIDQNLARANITTAAEAQLWRLDQTDLAAAAGLTFVAGSPHYSLCGKFLTDQSHGVTVIPSAPPQQQLALHRSGLFCISYSLLDSQLEKQSSTPAGTAVVVNAEKASGPNEPTYQLFTKPLEGDEIRNGLDSSGVKFFDANGAVIDVSAVKLGSVVAIYDEINVMRGLVTPYKVVTEPGGLDKNYCSLIVQKSQAYIPAPNSVCPESVNGIFFRDFDSQDETLDVQTSSGAALRTQPVSPDLPVIDPSGKTVSLTSLVINTEVNLIYSGETLIRLDIVSPSVDTNNVLNLSAEPSDFQDYIIGQYNQSAAQCGESGLTAKYTVNKVVADAFASVEENCYGGALYLYAKVNGVWQSVTSTQDEPNCATINKYDFTNQIVSYCLDTSTNTSIPNRNP